MTYADPETIPKPTDGHTPTNQAQAAISIRGVTKSYASGLQALQGIDLEIAPGEIFALLGPNGAGKTTLISIACGIINATTGVVVADGHDIARDYRAARSAIGLVPQELATDAFETVIATVSFSRGLFGKPPNPALLERILRDLSLWDKRSAKIITLSGGMKRRVMIAKALSHEPHILFLDEPTAGVDVELRRDMWALVRRPARQRRDDHPHHPLYRGGRGDGRPGRSHRAAGKLDPRGGKGGVDAQARPGASCGSSCSSRCRPARCARLPGRLDPVADGGTELTYAYDAQGDDERRRGAAASSSTRSASSSTPCKTRQSSLEDIFVDLVRSAERAP